MKKYYKSLVFVVSLFVFTLISSFFFVSYADDVIGKSKVDFWNSDTNSVASAELDVFQNEKYVYAVLPDQSIAIVYFLGNDKEVNIAADFPNQTVTAICTQAFNAFCGEYKTTEPINGHEIIQGMNFTSIVIPDTVTYIGKWNFVQTGNRYITDIHFPSSLKHLGYGTPQNTKFEVIPYIPGNALAENYYFVGNNSKKLQLEEGYIVIPSMFCDNHNATTVVIPSGVKIIREEAFAGLHNAEITIPESVEEIEKGSFVGSNNLNNTYIVVAGSYAEQWATDKGYKKKIIIPVKSIELDNSSLLLNKGKSSSLKAVLNPADASTKKVEWISSDSAIATVNNGTVKGISCGECDIICKSTDGSGVQAVCHVSVIQMVQSIQVKEKKVTVPFGGTYQPKIIIKPDDATDRTLSWTSSDESICRVNSDGLITAVGTGDCEITCATTDGSNKSLVISVHVPVFSSTNEEINVTDKNGITIPFDSHGLSLYYIQHKASTDKFFLYSLDNSGLYIYPIAEGSAKITLSNKLAPKDQMVYNVTIDKEAVFDNSYGDSEPLSIIIVPDKSVARVGDKVTFTYFVKGNVADVSYQGIQATGSNGYGGSGGSFEKTQKGKNAGTLSINTKNYASWQRIGFTITAVDTNGNTTKKECFAWVEDALGLTAIPDTLVAKVGVPVTIYVKCSGGIPPYSIDISTTVAGKQTRYTQSNIKQDYSFSIDPGSFPDVTMNCSLTIKDSSNGLPIISSPKHFSQLIGMQHRYVCSMAIKPIKFYRTFTIKKASGKDRDISEPLPDLKQIQHWILDNILEKCPVSAYAKAFVKKRTLKENARYHRAQKVVVSMDIKDFFPSISVFRVFDIFNEMGYSKSVSRFLSNLCCLNQSLPQGAPTSPYISNLCMLHFDAQVAEYTKNNNIRYTRYADDLTFSGDFNPHILIHDISTFLYQSGFRINAEKTRVAYHNARQEVTGIVVNSHLQRPKSERKKIRQEIYYIRKYGLDSHLYYIKETRANYLYHLLGKINFALFVNPKDEEMKSYYSFVKEMIVERKS